MSYRNEKAPSNGSFLVGTGGYVKFTGNKSGDKNQIVTWGEEGDQIESTSFSDLLELYDQAFAVSIVSDEEPELRPLGEPLKIGDLWYSSSSRIQYIYTNGIDDLPATVVGWTKINNGFTGVYNGMTINNGIIVGVATTAP
jgi:hypothetical protein